MSGLTGSVASLAQFSAALRQLPRVVAQKVATSSAAALTGLLRQTFDAGEDAFGGSWKPKADGTRATLVKTGALAQGLHFVAVGTLLRVRSPVGYAKYNYGSRPVTPRQGETLPVAWSSLVKRVTADVCRREMGQ